MATQAHPVQGATVLVADGDAMLRALLVAALRQDGWIVSEARDGAELVELVYAAIVEDGVPFDLVVSEADISGDGLEALLGLGAMLARTRIIITTARADTMTEHIARELGAAAVIEKPFGLDALLRFALDAVVFTGDARDGSSPPPAPPGP